MDEEWRDIPGYEGVYQASNLGRVRRTLSKTNGKAGNIRKPYRATNGYYTVSLSKDNKTSVRYLHHIVALTWIGERGSGMEINHIDGDKSNNSAVNLEWCTRQHNCQHASRVLGHNPPRNDVKGERHGQAKLTVEKVIEIRQLHSTGNYSQSKLSKMFGISQGQIYRIVHRQRWAHIGE